MDEKLQYLKIWQQAVANAGQALKNGDIKAAEKYHQDMEDAYERYKEAADYENGMQNAQFSTLNSTLESVIPKMFIKNKKALKECIKLIKEDKNLLSQYKFHKAMENFNCDGNATDYVNESLELVSKDINLKTLKESNRKLADFIIKNGFKGDELSEETMKFNESCDYLLSHRKKLTNLTEVTNNIKVVSDYITENKKNNENKVDVFSMAEGVEKKMNMLNEAEKSLVSDIMAANTPVAEQKKRNLFNNIKNECINKINKVLAEADGNEKERLLSMKETIMMKEFDASTLVSDVAKLLEVGAILTDNEHDKIM